MLHELKFKGEKICDEVYYGRKRHEIRKNDRNYKVGDIIKPIPIDDDLRPIDHPIANILYKVTFISYQWQDEVSPGKTVHAIAPGYVVMSIQPYVSVGDLVYQMMCLIGGR